jgi:hypothetical protein
MLDCRVIGKAMFQERAESLSYLTAQIFLKQSFLWSEIGLMTMQIILLLPSDRNNLKSDERQLWRYDCLR